MATEPQNAPLAPKPPPPPPPAQPASTVSAPTAPTAQTSPKVVLQTILAEATKYTLLAVFILYVFGFLIWHSYLASYGLSSVGFLQAEYLSAAFCYIIFFATFGLPPAMLFYHLLKRKAEGTLAIYPVLVVWPFMSSRVSALYFPTTATAGATKLQWFVLSLAALHLVLAAFLAYRQKTPRLLLGVPPTLLRRPEWVFVYLIIFNFTLLARNPNINGSFLMSTVLIFISFFSLGNVVPLKDVWPRASTLGRVLIGVFLCVVLVGHIHSFGKEQFGLIPRTVGGGKPELAYVKFSPQRSDLAGSLGIPLATNTGLSNGFVGPIQILLRSEKELVLVNPAEQALPEYLTNVVGSSVLANVTTNFGTYTNTVLITNQQGMILTSAAPCVTITIQTNRSYTITNAVARNPVKVTAKQLRSDLVDTIIFAR